jgi:putative transposase
MQVNNRPNKEQFGKPIAGSIPTVIRSFKSAVTKRINLMRPNKIPPIWQDNYYESIVRIESGLDQVREYIFNNPYQWEMDEDHPKYHSNDELDLNLYF